MENGERKKQLFIRWNVRTQEKKNWQIPSSLKYGNVSCLMPASMILDKFLHMEMLSLSILHQFILTSQAVNRPG